MTRIGVNILLIGLLLAGLGGAQYLLAFFLPSENIQWFETAVLLCWGIGAALALAGAAVGLIGRAANAKLPASRVRPTSRDSSKKQLTWQRSQ